MLSMGLILESGALKLSAKSRILRAPGSKHSNWISGLTMLRVSLQSSANQISSGFGVATFSLFGQRWYDPVQTN